MSSSDFSHRHPGTQHAMRTLRPNPSLTGAAHDLAMTAWVSAQEAVTLLSDGPGLSAGLRKLLEAKDCFVRQALIDGDDI